MEDEYGRVSASIPQIAHLCGSGGQDGFHRWPQAGGENSRMTGGVDQESHKVLILAVGQKKGNRLLIAGEEFEL
jgi:hypothetical protein